MYDPMQEILDRVKRIETRVTITGRHVGADVGGGKPVWSVPLGGNAAPGRIELPTRNCSVGELIKVVPRGWDRPINVYDQAGYVLTFTVVNCQGSTGLI